MAQQLQSCAIHMLYFNLQIMSTQKNDSKLNTWQPPNVGQIFKQGTELKFTQITFQLD